MTPRLDAAAWPSLCAFFRGYLHQDAGAEHASLESAFDQFWGDASADERQRFAAEWRAFRARTAGRMWHKVEPLVASLGAAWLPRRGSGFASLARNIDAKVAGR